MVRPLLASLLLTQQAWAPLSSAPGSDTPEQVTAQVLGANAWHVSNLESQTEFLALGFGPGPALTVAGIWE